MRDRRDGRRGPASCSALSSTAVSPASAFPRSTGARGSPAPTRRPSPRSRRPTRCPSPCNIPTFSILAPTLLDFGTEEQKRRPHPGRSSGARSCGCSSSPSPRGGSDLAGLVTRATRDGDVFILNGSKIWSSGAFRCDYAMCLARTDWHAPKHRGPDHVHRQDPPARHRGPADQNGRTGPTSSARSSSTTCAIPVEDVLGEVNDGWTVASRLLFHEREAVGGGSPYLSGTSGGQGDHGAGAERPDRAGAGSTGRASDPRVRQLVAEARVNDVVGSPAHRPGDPGPSTGHLPGPAGSLAPAVRGDQHRTPCDIAPRDRRRPAAAVWEEGDPLGVKGIEFLIARVAAWAAAATRCSATSSASGCSACPASSPPTGTVPSTRCGTTHHPRDPGNRRGARGLQVRGRSRSAVCVNHVS